MMLRRAATKARRAKGLGNNASSSPLSSPLLSPLSPLSSLLTRRSPFHSSETEEEWDLPRNLRGDVFLHQRSRPRRNRKTGIMRAMVRENNISPANFVYPLFVHEKKIPEPIDSMPGCARHTIDSLLREVEEGLGLGVGHYVIFPKINDNVKDNLATACDDADGLVPECIRAIKSKFPEAYVWTDVALDPYSSQGHDGVVGDDATHGDDGRARILNDVTVQRLCAQALCHAEAGCDVVSPSDMMDGRVGAIREALDLHGHTDVSIVSYTAKYASGFYGPFRDALDSAPREIEGAKAKPPKDKKTYQMDPANAKEALREAFLDEQEGADMLMVKPGLPYLDIIQLLSQNIHIPLAAYQVSGEYAMLKAAAANGWIDEKTAVLETLTCFKRAGASCILTYYAKDAARWLKEA
mmetsp:Transcript_6501/g.12882  ORF Transcript_6501/g.12882 Transcript_6501/m.12882 type:complete len:410 (-) Transcript_6501:166-1395(-)